MIPQVTTQSSACKREQIGRESAAFGAWDANRVIPDSYNRQVQHEVPQRQHVGNLVPLRLFTCESVLTSREGPQPLPQRLPELVVDLTVLVRSVHPQLEGLGALARAQPQSTAHGVR
eukprot:CAMPEP_0114147468 /NCGR_PEP_ID=MMETSP0043_2-20121206/21114_1 /TAXON_ID=464988 /ORGANISM="Hemiselmis andersenii, Strain CCMP644" /LENGTH=116 /DNA_ID=CAMNT_0001241991 /DNA_START=210 /DNA_END=561 /DNA_ORIENTATION=+